MYVYHIYSLERLRGVFGSVSGGLYNDNVMPGPIILHTVSGTRNMPAPQTHHTPNPKPPHPKEKHCMRHIILIKTVKSQDICNLILIGQKSPQ
jgi:hypothetical protein